MRRKSQEKRIVNYMNADGSLSSLECKFWTHPIMDLPKRISDLRKQGYVIGDRWESSSDGVRYKRYWLVEAPDE